MSNPMGQDRINPENKENIRDVPSRMKIAKN